MYQIGFKYWFSPVFFVVLYESINTICKTKYKIFYSVITSISAIAAKPSDLLSSKE